MFSMLGFARRVRRRVERWSLDLEQQELMREVTGGEGLHLEGRIIVIRPDRLSLGMNVHIGSGTYINCLGGVAIGDHTMISRHVTIYSYDHPFRDADMLPFGPGAKPRPVTIGRYVWIGMNASIAPGAVIGDGAILGMGVVVSGEVPENAIVVSEKPRTVGYRDAKRTKELAEANRFYAPSAVRRQER